MSKILNIARAGTPILYKRASEVKDPLSPDVCEHAQNMITALEHFGGLALAAPQVHLPLRIVVLNIPQYAPAQRYDFSTDPNHQALPLTIMINPTFKALSEDMQLGWESCLSFPGLRGKVNRYTLIEYTWTDLKGQTYTEKAQGFNARVIQHEYDHLDGIVYLERIEDFSTFGFEQETLETQRQE